MVKGSRVQGLQGSRAQGLKNSKMLKNLKGFWAEGKKGRGKEWEEREGMGRTGRKGRKGRKGIRGRKGRQLRFGHSMTQCPSVLRTKDPGSQGPRSPVFVFVCPPDVTKWPQRSVLSRFSQGDFSTDVFFFFSNFSVYRDVFRLASVPAFPRWVLRFLTCDIVRVCAVLSFSCGGNPFIFLSRRSPLVCFDVFCLCLSIRSHHKHLSARDNFGPLVIQIDNRNREAKCHLIFPILESKQAHVCHLVCASVSAILVVPNWFHFIPLLFLFSPCLSFSWRLFLCSWVGNF